MELFPDEYFFGQQLRSGQPANDNQLFTMERELNDLPFLSTGDPFAMNETSLKFGGSPVADSYVPSDVTAAVERVGMPRSTSWQSMRPADLSLMLPVGAGPSSGAISLKAIKAEPGSDPMSDVYYGYTPQSPEQEMPHAASPTRSDIVPNSSDPNTPNQDDYNDLSEPEHDSPVYGAGIKEDFEIPTKPEGDGNRRKQSHNAVERRRRNNINENISELRTVVPTIMEPRPSKASILRSAISYILDCTAQMRAYKMKMAQLQNDNNALRHENAQLRLQQTGPLGHLDGDDTVPQPTKKRRLNDDHAADHLMLVRPAINSAATDGARMLFAVAIFGFLFMGPVSVFNNGGAVAADAGTSRVLAGETAAVSGSWVSDMLASYGWMAMMALFKVLIGMVCFMVMFVWEPATPEGSEYFTKAQEERRKGEECVRKNELVRGEQHFQAALGLLGHQLPQSRLAVYLHLCVQIGRQIVHLVWLGEFLDHLLGSRRGALASYKEAALNYHNLQKIYACSESRRLSSLCSAVTSTNLAEAVGPSALLAEIYGTVAFVIRLYYPSYESVAAYYADKAWYTAQSLGVDKQMGWLCMTSGYHYMMIGEWAHAAQHLGRARKVFDEFSLGHLAKETTAFQGFGLYLQGEYTRGAEVFAKLVRDAKSDEDRSMAFFGAMGHVLCKLLPGGHIDSAIDVLERSLKAGDAQSRLQLILHNALLALARQRKGDYKLALGLADEVALLFEEFSSNFVVGLVAFFCVADVHLALWEAHEAGKFGPRVVNDLTAVVSDGDTLSEHLARAVRRNCAYLRKMGKWFPIVRPRALRHQGRYHCLVGQPAAGMDYIRSALTAAKDLQMGYEQAQSLYETARAVVEVPGAGAAAVGIPSAPGVGAPAASTPTGAAAVVAPLLGGGASKEVKQRDWKEELVRACVLFDAAGASYDMQLCMALLPNNNSMV